MDISCNLALFCASFRWLGPHRWFHTISLRLLKRFIVFCRLRVWNIRPLTICELIVLKSCHSFCPFAFLDRCMESYRVCIFFVIVGWIIHTERIVIDHDIYTLRFFSYLMWLLLNYLWRQMSLSRVIIVVDKVLILDDWRLCFSTDIFLWHRIWVNNLCQTIATRTWISQMLLTVWLYESWNWRFTRLADALIRLTLHFAYFIFEFKI